MKPILTISTLAFALAATGIAAQDINGAVNARQGQFRIISYNLGLLGSMAKGEVDYDAAAAQAAADNLVSIAAINQTVMWPAGSDNESHPTTRALPKIWDNLGDVVSKWNDFGTGAQAMQAAAGNGVEGIQGAIGQVGGTCKACHDAYRGPRR